METLEEEKEAMSQFTRDEAAFVSRSFANRVFDKADTEDRAGEATKETRSGARSGRVLVGKYNEDGVARTAATSTRTNRCLLRRKRFCRHLQQCYRHCTK